VATLLGPQEAIKSAVVNIKINFFIRVFFLILRLEKIQPDKIILPDWISILYLNYLLINRLIKEITSNTRKI
jgi:hypothetical protein